MKDIKKVVVAVVVAAVLGAGFYYQDAHAGAPAASGMEKDKSALNQKLTSSIEDYKKKANDPSASPITKQLNGAMQKLLEAIRTLTDKFSAAAEKTVSAVKSLAATVISIVKYNVKVVGDLAKGVKNTMMVGIAREQKLFEENLVNNIVRTFLADLFVNEQEAGVVTQMATIKDFESKRVELLDKSSLLDMTRKLYADAENRLQMLETFQKDVVGVLLTQVEMMKTNAMNAASNAKVKLPQSVLDSLDAAMPADIKKALISIANQVKNHLAERKEQLGEIGYFIGATDAMPAALRSRVEAKIQELKKETPEVREEKQAEFQVSSEDEFLNELGNLETPAPESKGSKASAAKPESELEDIFNDPSFNLE
jgi:hypothetical protein